MNWKQKSRCRTVIQFAVAVAVIMIAACLLDLIASFPHQPFFGQTTFSVCCLLASLCLLYMCRDAWVDLGLSEDSSRPRYQEAANTAVRPTRSTDRNGLAELGKEGRSTSQPSTTVT